MMQALADLVPEKYFAVTGDQLITIKALTIQ